MISWNRLLPGFRFEHLVVFQQFACVFIVEILLVGSDKQMTAPRQRSTLEGKNAFRFSSYRAGFGMGIIALIS